MIAILRDEQGHMREFEGFLREYEAEGMALDHPADALRVIEISRPENRLISIAKFPLASANVGADGQFK